MTDDVEVLVWNERDEVHMAFSQPVSGICLTRTAAQTFANRIGVVVAGIDIPNIIKAKPI